MHLSLLLLALPHLFPAPQDPPAPTDVFRALDFERALDAARTEKKVVLVDFFTTWCQPCKQLDRNTWTNDAVKEWLSAHVVPIKIDAERETGIAARYSVTGYPTMVFVQPGEAGGDKALVGAEIGRLSGYKTPQDFLVEARRTLEGRAKLDEARKELDARPDDPAAHLSYARALLRGGRNLEALDELLWAYDHSADRPEFGQARRLEVLRDIGALGRQNPRARQALLERRDRAQQALMAGGESIEEAAREMVALDQATGSTRHVLTVYEELKKREGTPPAVLKILFCDDVVQFLYQAKRYADMIDGMGDPLGHMDTVFGEVLHAREAQELLPGDISVKSNMAIAEGGRFYEALLALGRGKDAADLAEMMIIFEPRGQTYIALVNSAMKVGAREAAKTLGERGVAEAPEGVERDRLKALVARLFPAQK